MASVLQLRRDTTTNIAAATGAQGEVWVDLTEKCLVVNDGTTEGGIYQASQSFVLAQIALLSAGTIQNLVWSSSCS